MPRSASFATLFIALAFIPACAGHQSQGSSAKPPAQSASRETMDESSESHPLAPDVHSAMQSKLAHAQAILEGLALADFEQVQSNARDLKYISQSADWLTHDTESYYTFSTRFREVCDELINHSRQKNIAALSTDYGNLTNTCIACHDYLRKERLTKDIPGKVTLR